MKTLRCFALITLTVQGAASFAQASYEAEANEVVLRTPLLTKGIDLGLITIKAEDHITLFATKLGQSEKMTELCGRNPDLGLLFLDGRLSLDRRTPKVTETRPWGEKSPESIAGGYVHSYVLKGEDAKDLLDLLLTYQQVGFSIPSRCAESAKYAPGQITVNFATRGLDRALRRLK